MQNKLKAFNAKRKLKAATKGIMAANRMRMLSKISSIAKSGKFEPEPEADATETKEEVDTTPVEQKVELVSEPVQPAAVPEPVQEPYVAPVQQANYAADSEDEMPKKKKGLFSCCG